MARERLEAEPIVLVEGTARNDTAIVSATGATISGEASSKRLLNHRHVWESGCSSQALQH